jgi:hypothetical protein
MKSISIRLLVALLTFTAGVSAFALWLFLRPPDSGTANSPRAARAEVSLPLSGTYENPAAPDGLFHAVRRSGWLTTDTWDGYDERALVLSYDEKPAGPQGDSPEAPTRPGFYLTRQLRFDFERVEVIGRKVYFRTHGVAGVRYEFSGSTGEEVIPDSAPPVRVHTIKGTLTRSKGGEVMAVEEIKFYRLADSRTGP